MQKIPRPKRYTATIPTTPCTPEMRQMIVKEAQSRNMPLSEAVRLAVSLFLHNADTKLSVDKNLSEKGE